VTTPLAERSEVQSAIDLLATWIEAQIHYREGKRSCATAG
jgi:hypothetical protein